ncbi:MAG: hypothetical protein ACKVQA_06975 [Burkholderiales bacterium]
MNRVTVIIEAEHDGEQCKTRVSAQFADGDYRRDKVLDVFEAALRGAGYLCPMNALNVDDEAHQ